MKRVLALAAVVFLAGCFGGLMKPDAPPPPEQVKVACPARDAPAPAPWVSPKDPLDMRTYPDAFDTNRSHHGTHDKAINVYNAARAECARKIAE